MPGGERAPREQAGWSSPDPACSAPALLRTRRVNSPPHPYVRGTVTASPSGLPWRPTVTVQDGRVSCPHRTGTEAFRGRGNGGLGAGVPDPGSHPSEHEQPPHGCDQRFPSSRPSGEAGNLGLYVTRPDLQTWATNSSFLRPVNHVGSADRQAAGCKPLTYRVSEQVFSSFRRILRVGVGPSIVGMCSLGPHYSV